MDVPRWVIAGLVFGLVSCVAGNASALDSFLGLRVSAPMVVSGSVGLRLGDEGAAGYHPALELEAGLGGGRILLGLDSLGPGFGAGIKGAFLRTWGASAGVDEDQSYIGAVIEAGIDRFFAELGGYAQVAGDGNDDWLASFGVGFRL